jgi:hypothetical protein
MSVKQQDGDKYRLPSVKDLKSRFEQGKGDSTANSRSDQPVRPTQTRPSNGSVIPNGPAKTPSRSPIVDSMLSSPKKPVAAMSPVAKKIEAAKNKSQISSSVNERVSEKKASEGQVVNSRTKEVTSEVLQSKATKVSCRSRKSKVHFESWRL